MTHRQFSGKNLFFGETFIRKITEKVTTSRNVLENLDFATERDKYAYFIENKICIVSADLKDPLEIIDVTRRERFKIRFFFSALKME